MEYRSLVLSTLLCRCHWKQMPWTFNVHHQASQVTIVWPCLPAWYAPQNSTKGNGERWSLQRKTAQSHGWITSRTEQASHCRRCYALQNADDRRLATITAEMPVRVTQRRPSDTDLLYLSLHIANFPLPLTLSFQSPKWWQVPIYCRDNWDIRLSGR